MKQAAMVAVILGLTTFVIGQQPSATQGKPAGQTGTAQAPAAPVGKRPPQAKTQPEFDAYKAAMANPNDALAMEKTADDFAAKFPDSELRILLYRVAMHAYQTANNADKMMEMGRKVLALDPDDPEALSGVAQVLAERTRDTDLDKDQRWQEALGMCEKALQTVDTDVAAPPGTPQDKIDAYKNFLRSNVYLVMGSVQYNQTKYADAQASLQKSIDVFPSQPDPVAVLRLALAFDKQEKYADALKYATQAVGMTQENTSLGTAARHEHDRLAQLTGAAAPGTNAPAPGSKPAGQNPPTTTPPQN
jgi:tetratricopeptide (TPR) repeat protein